MGSFLDAALQQIQALPSPVQSKLPAGYAAGPMGGILQQLTDQQNAANTANNARFQTAASLYQNAGTSAKADAAQTAQNQIGDMNQQLVNHGLYNSTLFAPLTQGITREQNRQDQRIDEGTAGQLGGLLASRNDTGPNMSLFANLIEQASKTASQQKVQMPTQYMMPQGGMSNFAGIYNPGNTSAPVNQNVPKAQYIGPKGGVDMSGGGFGGQFGPGS